MIFSKVALALGVIAVLSFACTRSNPGSNQTATRVPVRAASPTPTVDQFASARANFQKRCTPCHGDTAEGGVVKVDNKKLKVPSLREGHALSHSDEQVRKQITNGGDGMPPFKDKLKAEEITELVRFIRQEFQGNKMGQGK